MITYRKAELSDIQTIQNFTDFWLAGRGKRQGVPGSSNDCFISTGQHIGYLKKSTVLLCFDNEKIIGWAVKHYNGSLIHLLIAAPYRNQGIGSTMLRMLNPPRIRSKTDQSTGNPTPFYEKFGYEKVRSETSRPTFYIPKKRRTPQKNIDVLEKKTT